MLVGTHLVLVFIILDTRRQIQDGAAQEDEEKANEKPAPSGVTFSRLKQRC